MAKIEHSCVFATLIFSRGLKAHTASRGHETLRVVWGAVPARKSFLSAKGGDSSILEEDEKKKGCCKKVFCLLLDFWRSF